MRYGGGGTPARAPRGDDVEVLLAALRCTPLLLAASSSSSSTDPGGGGGAGVVIGLVAVGTGKKRPRHPP